MAVEDLRLNDFKQENEVHTRSALNIIEEGLYYSIAAYLTYTLP